MKEIVKQAAERFASSLQNKYGNYIVGPAEPVVNRIRNHYLMELLLQLPRDSKLSAQCNRDIAMAVMDLYAVVPDRWLDYPAQRPVSTTS